MAAGIADFCYWSSCEEFQAAKLAGSPSASGPFADRRGLFSLGPTADLGRWTLALPSEPDVAFVIDGERF